MSLAKVIGPDIEELIRENPEELPAAVANIHPADLAELLDDLPREDRLVLFEALPVEQGAALLSELKGETLRLVLHSASPAKLGSMLDRLPADEVTFLLEHLTQRQREAILAKMSPRDAAEVERLQRYPPQHRRPHHDREVRHDPARVDRGGDARPPEAHRSGGRDRPEPLRRRRGRPPGRLRRAAQALPRAAGPEDRRHDGAAPPDRPAPTPARKRSRGSSPSTTSTRSRSSTTENKLLGIITVDDVIDILIEEQTEGRPAPRRRLGHRRRPSSRATSRRSPGATCACGSTGCCCSS